MENIGAQVKYRAILSPSASDDLILQHLYRLKTMRTRIFVVHMLPALASHFFKKAHEAGMMARGYAWIITDVLTGLLSHLDPQDLDYMQGVLGVKPYIPPSNHLTNFEKKWRRRVMNEYPEMDRVELDMFGIWFYDSIYALATTLQRIETGLISTSFKRPKKPLTDLVVIGTSEMGSRILPMIQNTRLKGLSGDFHVINGQLQMLSYQIVNVFGNGEKHIGFWNSENGLSNRLGDKQRLDDNLTNKDGLGAIIWPGDSLETPNGWETLTRNCTHLRVGVPAIGGFKEFIEAYEEPITKAVHADGFFIDVFYAVIDAMPYCVNYTLIPYVVPDGMRSGYYNDLVYQIYLEKFDMVVGDVAILWNRSNYADFALPITESGIAMLVLVKDGNRKNAWIFMEPLEPKLWITIGAFFIYTGLVVWVLEHRVNKEFRGPPHLQVGMIFWFPFSTLVFAHKEKMTSNLSRFVVIVWVFVVLVMTSNYTASLSSMLTIRKLQPSFTNIYELIARGEYIGYQDGSYVENMLINKGFPKDKLRKYSNFEEYVKALSNGSRNNGVSAIVDDVPYLKMLQAKNCNKFMMVGPIQETAGLGFALPKGSPLVADFSRAVLKVMEGQMTNISNRWFAKEDNCVPQNGDVQPFDKLTLASFEGLFLIAGLSSTYALIVFMCSFLYENKEILISQASMHEKMSAMIRNFDEKKDDKPPPSETHETIDNSHVYDEPLMTISQLSSPSIIVEHQGEGITSRPETMIQP